MSKKTLPYVRILGFNNNGKKLLSEIAKNNPKLKVITSVKKFTDENKNKKIKRMLELDIFATNVYTLAYSANSLANLDFTHNLVCQKGRGKLTQIPLNNNKNSSIWDNTFLFISLIEEFSIWFIYSKCNKSSLYTQIYYFAKILQTRLLNSVGLSMVNPSINLAPAYKTFV